ncbi:MAG: holo-ACP synthase [bacterium]|nr:holo-ACP synthase [bacterium]
MVIGVGIDIISTERIKNALNRYGDRFIKRIYCPGEIEYCGSRKEPHLHYAARFAAKEALVKALGTGFRFGIKHTEIETKLNELGKPELTLHNTTFAISRQKGITRLSISLSHNDEQATAIVIAETNPPAQSPSLRI